MNKENIPVADLELSIRSLNCLRNAQITTVGELLSKTDRELLALPNFGRRCLQEVRELLASLHLALPLASQGISNWAFEKACELAGRAPHHIARMSPFNSERIAIEALARYVEQHEQAPAPREVLCAREACARIFEKTDPDSGLPQDFREGRRDKEAVLLIAVTAINLFNAGYAK